MYADPMNRPRYCWRCRKRVGRGPGAQVCPYCRSYNHRHMSDRTRLDVADLAERIAYYTARADLLLDLFAESPWAREPGAHNRLWEAQAKTAGATGRVAPAHKVEKLPE